MLSFGQGFVELATSRCCKCKLSMLCGISFKGTILFHNEMYICFKHFVNFLHTSGSTTGGLYEMHICTKQIRAEDDGIEFCEICFCSNREAKDGSVKGSKFWEIRLCRKGLRGAGPVRRRTFVSHLPFFCNVL